MGQDARRCRPVRRRFYTLLGRLPQALPRGRIRRRAHFLSMGRMQSSQYSASAGSSRSVSALRRIPGFCQIGMARPDQEPCPPRRRPHGTMGPPRAGIHLSDGERLMFHLAADYLRSAGWRDWDVLQLPGGADVVWWIFRRGQDIPAVVGKFCDPPAAVEAGRRECAALELLSPFADRLGLPSVLFQTDTRGGSVYLQSGVPGKPLRDELSPSDGKHLSAQIDIAEGWLEKFQMLAPPAENSGAAFRQVLAGASERLPKLLLSTASAALPLLSAVPAVAVHGDFWAKNVLAAPRRVSWWIGTRSTMAVPWRICSPLRSRWPIDGNWMPSKARTSSGTCFWARHR